MSGVTVKVPRNLGRDGGNGSGRIAEKISGISPALAKTVAKNPPMLKSKMTRRLHFMARFLIRRLIDRISTPQSIETSDTPHRKRQQKTKFMGKSVPAASLSTVPND